MREPLPRFPEWLPLPGEPLPAGVAELIVAVYDEHVGEVCAGIRHTLARRHNDVRVHRYTAAEIERNWSPRGVRFIVAHVVVVSWAHAKVARFAQIWCSKEDGLLRIDDRDDLLEAS